MNATRIAVLILIAILACTIASARTMTRLSCLDTQQEVDLFASRVRYCMVEPIDKPRTQGSGAMRIRFFGHPSLDDDPRVRARYRFRGLRYTNWTPYDSLMVDIHNPADEQLQIAMLIRGPRNRCRIPVSLSPAEWTTVSVSINQLRDKEIDTDNVESLQLRLELEKRKTPARIIVDNIRLVGDDDAAIRAARKEGDRRRARIPKRDKPRTRAVLSVADIAPTGSTISVSEDVPVAASTEVVVCGGGLAGVAAAVTAARMGADVILIERTGALGGMATTGLVPPIFNLPLADGILKEFCDRLKKVGGKKQNRNPEVMKHVLLKMMQESGAKLMLYSLGVDAIVKDGAIGGVIVENKSGTQAVLGDIVIDCTGDGDIAAAAGAPFEIGRGRDDQTQRQTLMFLLGNVDTGKLGSKLRDKFSNYVKKARENGDWNAPYAGGACIQPVVKGKHGVVNINSVNIPEVSGVDVEDLTYAHIESQLEAMELVDFYREYVPGFEGCYLLKTAKWVGVRESRRIMGEYVLSGEEALSGAEFADSVARGFFPIDIHSPDRTGDAGGPRPSEPYEIPYRCLVPRKIDNLLVAGRCISADHVAHGSLRVMGTTMPLGEAAGCAAGMCIANDTIPRQLDGEAVHDMLQDFNAIPQIGVKVPDNIAMAKNGTVATADSTLKKKTNYPPKNAIDGVVTEGMLSRWLSNREALPHWIQLEFPEPKTFSSVQLHLFTMPKASDFDQYIPRGFDIQIKRDGDWQTVASVTENSELRPKVEFASVTAQTMRVLFTVSCPSDHIVRLREVVVR